jgi:hypothetical protein
VAVKINIYKYKPYRISLKRTHHPLSMYEEIHERCVDLGVDPAVCDVLITILSSPTSTMVELMRLIAETPMFPTDLATEMALVFAYRPGMWFPPSLRQTPHIILAAAETRAAPDQGVAALAHRVQSLKL